MVVSLIFVKETMKHQLNKENFYLKEKKNDNL